MFKLDTEHLELQASFKEFAENEVKPLAKEIDEQFALDMPTEYLEPFAFALQKRIKNAEIRNLHVVI